MKTSKAILLGNGLNRVSSSYSWENLIDDLIRISRNANSIDIAGKPFPLLYEEIYLNEARKSHLKEMRLKSHIARLVSRFKPSPLHNDVLGLGLEHILTTNYDYTLESCIGSKVTSQNLSYIKETRYSLFRCQKIERTHFWHIHGESRTPASITLGYEQYAGYLQQMRNYVVTGIDYKNKKISSFIERIKERDRQLYSWVDLFFTGDIYILGLSLDFVEMHLWWLLTFRARQMYEKRMAIKNTITYLFPLHEKPQLKSRLSLLETTGVKLKAIEVKGKNWIDYYQKALQYIKHQ